MNVTIANIPSVPGTLAVKVSEKGDIGGSLWQLKSDSQQLQTEVKKLLES